MARKINKSLLSEGEMRRFMKLANISPLQEMGSMMAPGMRDDEDEDAPGMRDYMQEQDEEMEVADAEMEAPEEEAAPAEPDMEMDMEMGAEEEGGGQMIDLDDFLSALETALEDVTGEEVSTDMDMEGGEEAPEEGGDDLDMEMSPEPDMGDEEQIWKSWQSVSLAAFVPVSCRNPANRPVVSRHRSPWTNVRML